MSPGGSVRVELNERSYDIHVGAGAARRACAAAARAAAGAQVALLVDRTVAAKHGVGVRAMLCEEGAKVTLHELPPGEEAKRLSVVEELCGRLVAAGVERRDVIVGLGGGATTDVAGFTAAVFLRGLRWAGLPTTLLAQVDAAVGGKTGVNLPEGKNLVGAFHQPLTVGCDPLFLESLPERAFRAGLAEVVKTAWIGDPELFEMLEAQPPMQSDAERLAQMVRRCLAVKARIVALDERETGPRAVLNFGHTIGHAMEIESGGTLLHGEAVALGMVAAVHISVETGRCERALLERLMRLLERLGLPTRAPRLDPDRVLERTRADKKRRGQTDRYQLTRGLGFVSVARGLPEGAPRAALEFLCR